MNMKVRSVQRVIISAIFLPLVFCVQQACAAKQESAEFQAELLEIAFETASAIPTKPHIKDRSRAQEAVAAASLALDQPQQALEYIEQIGNWRKGLGYGDLARYFAQHGSGDAARQYLDLAEEVSESAEDWRRDRIRVKVAQAHALLGQSSQAEEYEEGVEFAEMGKVAGTMASIAQEEDFEPQMDGLRDLISKGNFDITRNALHSCAVLFDRFYKNTEQRGQAEKLIRESWGKMPLFVRIELLMVLTDAALKHSDLSQAFGFVNEAQQLVEGVEWPPEKRMELISRIAELRFRAGDTENAKSDMDALLVYYDSEEHRIVNIYKAGALRPLAEAYQAIGETSAALTVYKRALESGIENPNSRPQAEDLSATCVSMALHGVAPDEELWMRIREIKGSLGEPW
ncbi:MAG: hypothetical protein JW937_02890 [Candidatus Omnitrophica bacterium]|nr:hypothetical protein [Candidatus Omnitrophota bacterium]